ncbi:MAG: DUF2238 domain-containing protein [Campylobacterota bacterium]|nr:DUF2238 domain-containing protein [Campylobacterota bacterium]
METLPILILVFIMIKTYKKFPLTPFSYIVIYIGSVLVFIGAHYSYQHVPIFDLLKEIFEWERNNYDKLGHFFQGVVPFIISREYFIRYRLINSKKLMDFLALSFSVALSALWEIIEWLSVVTLMHFGSDKPASAFLGAQNYYWDAQSDIFFALLGALSALIIFGKYHERKIHSLLPT